MRHVPLLTPRQAGDTTLSLPDLTSTASTETAYKPAAMAPDVYFPFILIGAP